MEAALYTRVSTLEQANKGYSLEAQKERNSKSMKCSTHMKTTVIQEKTLYTTQCKAVSYFAQQRNKIL